MSRTDLYRHFDNEGRLLYVGVSLCVLSRIIGHRSFSTWFEDVSTITIEHYETRDEAIAAETLAIKTENPIHNVDQTPRRKKRGPVVVSEEIRRSTYNATEFAEIVGVSVSTVKHWADRNKPPFHPVEGLRPYRWSKELVDNIMKPTVR